MSAPVPFGNTLQMEEAKTKSGTSLKQLTLLAQKGLSLRVSPPCGTRTLATQPFQGVGGIPRDPPAVGHGVVLQ
jgi:hypothetical protein